MIRKIKKKKAAMELSMTTIVVVVLSLVLLVMGFVLIRSIMCGAIDLTEGLNSRSKNMIDGLFSSTGGDVTCIGLNEEIVMYAGRTNRILCSVKAQNPNSRYEFSIRPIAEAGTLSTSDVDRWIIGGSRTTTRTFNPSSQEPQVIFSLNIPKNAPIGTMGFEMNIKPVDRDDPVGEWSGTLLYRVEQLGAITGFMC